MYFSAQSSRFWVSLQRNLVLPVLIVFLTLLSAKPGVNATHHMKHAPLHYVNRRDDTRPLKVTNNCPETIYPGIATQGGTTPSRSGFKLNPGDSQTLAVSADWQGRVWGRTNCSFNPDGTGPANNGGNNGGGSACFTGDCGGVVNCMVTVRGPQALLFWSPLQQMANGRRYQQGNTPVTLAEFTLASTSGQTFYDISLVDGYNIPIGIVSLHVASGNSSITSIPPNLTNPVCIGTAALLASQGSTNDATLGTNSSFPLPLDQSVSASDCQTWCPWDLQLQQPTGPKNGVYSYPDDSIQRPQFNPCYSACAKYNQPGDCCVGAYGSPSTCKPSQYSQNAKNVCPDAYSYAFDDQTSTFIIPSGGGFEVIFCPAGRSTTILTTMSNELHQLHQYGTVTQWQLAARDGIAISRSNDGAPIVQSTSRSFSALVALVAFAVWAWL